MQKALQTKSLVKWLEKQPQDRTYNYQNTNDCLLTRYLVAAKLRPVWVMPEWWRDAKGREHTLPDGWDRVAAGRSGIKGGVKRYRGALKRARKLLEAERRAAA